MKTKANAAAKGASGRAGCVCLALPPGRYEYRFVVDGQWVDDPAATELIPNSFGTANAVLLVEAHKPVAIARSAGPTPTANRRAATRNAPAQRQACCA